MSSRIYFKIVGQDGGGGGLEEVEAQRLAMS